MTSVNTLLDWLIGRRHHMTYGICFEEITASPAHHFPNPRSPCPLLLFHSDPRQRPSPRTASPTPQTLIPQHLYPARTLTMLSSRPIHKPSAPTTSLARTPQHHIPLSSHLPTCPRAYLHICPPAHLASSALRPFPPPNCPCPTTSPSPQSSTYHPPHYKLSPKTLSKHRVVEIMSRHMLRYY